MPTGGTIATSKTPGLVETRDYIKKRVFGSRVPSDSESPVKRFLVFILLQKGGYLVTSSLSPNNLRASRSRVD
ncbi:hypothetical protein RRG08_031871 [Elysia crispata]|uniref:Uncharacterized protein n=1 Tax=Elysia crispata TaxID=231223 RepID=A0AAE1AGY8_9GAST|nr:hypothetical protein RRG08_031871 [Elysia crispata]